MMSGKTPDISQFCEFAFYDWVMFGNDPIAFPNENPVLGCYLEPATDVGLALTAKILKANGEVVHQSMYRALTPEEVENATHVCQRIEFDVSIMDCYGPRSSPGDFPDLDIYNLPEHHHFDDVAFEGRVEEWVKRWCALSPE